MARGSIGKRVARAASTGGGRASSRRNTPWSWWTTMAAIILIGVVLVVYSRHERLNPANAASGVAPTTTDHWQQALAFDICGTLQPNLPANPNEKTAGIYTAGDGNIHVQPVDSSTTGHKATLGKFAQLYPGMVLTSTSLRYPGGSLHRNGQKCGDKAASVQVKVWDSPTSTTGHVVAGNPADLLLENGQLITIAFVPSGTSIPKPPGTNVTNLINNMNASASQAGQSTRVTLPPTVSTVPASGSTTATTAAGTTGTTFGGSTTTTAGRSTTTTSAGSTSTTKGP